MKRGRQIAGMISGILTVTFAAAQRSQPAVGPETGCGPIHGQVLRCQEFGFVYTVPFGWVDRTGDMQSEANATSGGGSDQPSASSKSQALLAIFERPPGAPGDSVNSAVVIAAESHMDYHGIKTAADYFGPVTELAEQRGFNVVNEPYEFALGQRKLVRADYSKQRGKLTMSQSTLAMIEKGYIVSFTFVAGSEDDIEELVGKLSFGGGRQIHK